MSKSHLATLFEESDESDRKYLNLTAGDAHLLAIDLEQMKGDPSQGRVKKLTFEGTVELGEGAFALGEALAKNRTVQELNLRGTHRDHEHCPVVSTPQACKLLQGVLTDFNKTLTTCLLYTSDAADD